MSQDLEHILKEIDQSWKKVEEKWKPFVEKALEERELEYHTSVSMSQSGVSNLSGGISVSACEDGEINALISSWKMQNGIEDKELMYHTSISQSDAGSSQFPASPSSSMASNLISAWKQEFDAKELEFLAAKEMEYHTSMSASQSDSDSVLQPSPSPTFSMGSSLINSWKREFASKDSDPFAAKELEYHTSMSASQSNADSTLQPPESPTSSMASSLINSWKKEFMATKELQFLTGKELEYHTSESMSQSGRGSFQEPTASFSTTASTTASTLINAWQNEFDQTELEFLAAKEMEYNTSMSASQSDVGSTIHPPESPSSTASSLISAWKKEFFATKELKYLAGKELDYHTSESMSQSGRGSFQEPAASFSTTASTLISAWQKEFDQTELEFLAAKEMEYNTSISASQSDVGSTIHPPESPSSTSSSLISAWKKEFVATKELKYLAAKELEYHTSLSMSRSMSHSVCEDTSMVSPSTRAVTHQQPSSHTFIDEKTSAHDENVAPSFHRPQYTQEIPDLADTDTNSSSSKEKYVDYANDDSSIFMFDDEEEDKENLSAKRKPDFGAQSSQKELATIIASAYLSKNAATRKNESTLFCIDHPIAEKDSTKSNSDSKKAETIEDNENETKRHPIVASQDSLKKSPLLATTNASSNNKGFASLSPKNTMPRESTFKQSTLLKSLQPFPKISTAQSRQARSPRNIDTHIPLSPLNDITTTMSPRRNKAIQENEGIFNKNKGSPLFCIGSTALCQQQPIPEKDDMGTREKGCYNDFLCADSNSMDEDSLYTEGTVNEWSVDGGATVSTYDRTVTTYDGTLNTLAGTVNTCEKGRQNLAKNSVNSLIEGQKGPTEEEGDNEEEVESSLDMLWKGLQSGLNDMVTALGITPGTPLSEKFMLPHPDHCIDNASDIFFPRSGVTTTATSKETKDDKMLSKQKNNISSVSDNMKGNIFFPNTATAKELALIELAKCAALEKHLIHKVSFDELAAIDLANDVEISRVAIPVPLGLLFKENSGGCIVTRVFEHSNAAKCRNGNGVKVGDQLGWVNGKPTKRMHVDQIISAICKSPDPQKCELTFIRYVGPMHPLHSNQDETPAPEAKAEGKYKKSSLMGWRSTRQKIPENVETLSPKDRQTARNRIEAQQLKRRLGLFGRKKQ